MITIDRFDEVDFIGFEVTAPSSSCRSVIGGQHFLRGRGLS